MEILGKLFASVARVKLMKLFLFNADTAFDLVDITTRSKITSVSARKELGILEGIGMIRRRIVTREVASGTRKSKKKVAGWYLSLDFQYLEPLQQLLLNTDSLHPDEIINKLKRAGKLKLVVIAGIFLQQWDSRIDILIVGDQLKPGLLEASLKSLEAEIGKELKFAAFETTDFLYRINVYDKLVRDVFDYPHRKIVNKLSFK